MKTVNATVKTKPSLALVVFIVSSLANVRLCGVRYERPNKPNVKDLFTILEFF